MTRFMQNILENKFLQKALVFTLVLFSAWVFFTQNAYGLEVQKFSARPNQTSGSTVVGGEITRLSWEAKVSSEQITAVDLILPQNSSSEGAKVNVSVLDGLQRLEVNYESAINSNTVHINFGDALPKDA